MNFSLILIHYFNHLQLKFDLNKQIPINAINSLKIANRPKNRPTFKMAYQMSYVGSRKMWRAEVEKKVLPLPSAYTNTW